MKCTLTNFSQLNRPIKGRRHRLLETLFLSKSGDITIMLTRRWAWVSINIFLFPPWNKQAVTPWPRDLGVARSQRFPAWNARVWPWCYFASSKADWRTPRPKTGQVSPSDPIQSSLCVDRALPWKTRRDIISKKKLILSYIARRIFRCNEHT